MLAEARFVVEAPPGADSSTVQFVQKLLPVCESHAFIARFLEACPVVACFPLQS